MSTSYKQLHFDSANRHMLKFSKLNSNVLNSKPISTEAQMHSYVSEQHALDWSRASTQASSSSYQPTAPRVETRIIRNEFSFPMTVATTKKLYVQAENGQLSNKTAFPGTTDGFNTVVMLAKVEMVNASSTLKAPSAFIDKSYDKMVIKFGSNENNQIIAYVHVPRVLYSTSTGRVITQDRYTLPVRPQDDSNSITINFDKRAESFGCPVTVIDTTPADNSASVPVAYAMLCSISMKYDPKSVTGSAPTNMPEVTVELHKRGTTVSSSTNNLDGNSSLFYQYKAVMDMTRLPVPPGLPSSISLVPPTSSDYKEIGEPSLVSARSLLSGGLKRLIHSVPDFKKLSEDDFSVPLSAGKYYTLSSNCTATLENGGVYQISYIVKEVDGDPGSTNQKITYVLFGDTPLNVNITKLSLPYGTAFRPVEKITVGSFSFNTNYLESKVAQSNAAKRNMSVVKVATSQNQLTKPQSAKSGSTSKPKARSASKSAGQR